MREVTLRIRHHGEPESDISAEFPTLTLRPVSGLTGTAAERKRIHEVVGPTDDIGNFVAALNDTDKVRDARLLAPPKDEHAFLILSLDGYQWDSIIQRLTDHGVFFRSGARITAGWEHWSLFLEDTDELSPIIEDIEDAGNDVDLVRDIALSEVRGRTQLSLFRIGERLTERQQDVLLTAIERGYYGPKSATSIEEIAQIVGIAPTTAWEHLARAEQKIMAEIGSSLDIHQ